MIEIRKSLTVDRKLIAFKNRHITPFLLLLVAVFLLLLVNFLLLPTTYFYFSTTALN